MCMPALQRPEHLSAAQCINVCPSSTPLKWAAGRQQVGEAISVTGPQQFGAHTHTPACSWRSSASGSRSPDISASASGCIAAAGCAAPIAPCQAAGSCAGWGACVCGGQPPDGWEWEKPIVAVPCMQDLAVKLQTMLLQHGRRQSAPPAKVAMLRMCQQPLNPSQSAADNAMALQPDILTAQRATAQIRTSHIQHQASHAGRTSGCEL